MYDGGWIIAGLLVLFMTFVFGAVVQENMRDAKCKEGKPVVVEGKVYRCVESK
jgi:hypothetical protein